MRRRSFRTALLATTALAGLSALSCADDPNAPGEPVPTSMVIVSGSGQNGIAGSELAQPLIVEVRDGSNLPLPGVVVNFVVVKGNGSVFAGAAETDNNGRAQDYWRLGTSTADSQRVEVRSVSGSTGAKEVHGTFIATALPGPAAAVVISVDTMRLFWVGDTSTIPATAQDQYGNVIPAAPIIYRFAGTAGVITVDSLTGRTAAQANGSRRVRASLGALADTARVVVTPIVADLEPALQTVTVNSLQLPFVPPVVAYDSGGSVMAAGELRWKTLNPTILQVADSVTGSTLGIGVGIGRVEVRSVATGVRDTVRIRVQQVVDSVAVSPPTSIVPIGDTLQLTAMAFDSNNVAIPGLGYAWSSDDSTIVAVDQLGRAFGRGYGATSIHATATGSSYVAAGLVTVRNADTLSVAMHNGNGQAGIVAQPLPVGLSVRVTNQFGEGVADVPVVWWSPSGSVVAGAAPVTDAAGFALASVTLDTVAGIKLAYATIGADTAAFSFVARPDVPAAFSRGAPAAQIDTVGDVAPVLPRVRVTDRYGNGVPDLEVRFTPRGGSTGQGTVQITGPDGRATIGVWQMDTVPGSDTLIAVLRDTVSQGFARIRFTADVVQDSASFQRSLLSASDTVRERDSTIVEVRLRDRFNNPLIKADGTVTFSAGFGTFGPVSNTNDGWYRATYRPNGARGTTNIRAALDGDSIWAAESIISRSYLLRWLGGSTDYNAVGNWAAPGGPPSTLDSLYIPAGLPNYPQLVQNTTVENVVVEDLATLNLGSFDLTVTNNVVAGLSGGITNTTGRLFLVGVARTIQGRLPRLRVTGSYSLTANAVARQIIQVDAGRLTVSGFRLQVENN